MMARGRILFFILFSTLFLALVFSLTSQSAETQRDSIPSSFRISPSKSGEFINIKVIYNPDIDRYVVFLGKWTDPGTVTIFYSRLYNSKGKTDGPWQEIYNGPILGNADVSYNEKNNEFLFIWNDRSRDAIYGRLLNGKGKVKAGKTGYSKELVAIKKSSGYGTGRSPKVAWIGSKNHYAVSWTSAVSKTHPSNGMYLATFNSKLKRVIKPLRVKQQTMKNYYAYYVAGFIALENKLFWGSAEDGPGNRIKPVVWFTDFKGKMLSGSNQDTKGMIYPGKKVKGDCSVKAAYAPSKDLFLLHWNASDHSFYREQNYRENYYRLMDSKGKFKTKAKKIPKKTQFQSQGSAVYSSNKNRFFIVFPEYKVLYENMNLFPSIADNYRSYFGGRLYGLYINSKGRIVDKAKSSAIPLTKTFKDPVIRMFFGSTAYNYLNNEYFVTYELSNYDTYDVEAWGLIYR